MLQLKVMQYEKPSQGIFSKAPGNLESKERNSGQDLGSGGAHGLRIRILPSSESRIYN